MKKISLLTSLAVLMFSSTAIAGEFLPYVGIDYVNSTLNLKGKYTNAFDNNFDVPSFNAGLKFVDYGSVEVFLNRSFEDKKVLGGNVSRAKFYSYGGDVLFNAYNLSEGTILGSIGYGRTSTNFKFNGKSDKDKTNAIRLGFGGELNPSPEWGLRAMYRYSIADGDTYKNSKEFSLGVRYYFQAE